MESDNGGLSPSERQRQTAAEIARKKVLAAYSSTVNTVKNLPLNSRDILLKKRNSNLRPPISNSDNFSTEQAYIPSDQLENSPYSQAQPNYHIPQNPNQIQTYNQSYNTAGVQPVAPHQETQPRTTDFQNPANQNTYNTSALKDSAINQSTINEEWAKYHSAWQDYYKNYYNDYYSKAAQNYLATEKMKNERIATGKVHRTRNLRRLIPIGIVAIVVLLGLFLQYNRLIFAPIMAYVSPDTGSINTTIEAVDPTISQTVSAEPRLIIPKLNVDVPVEFNIPLESVNSAMNRGVAQFSIPGADAMPGQIGNLVISGHSAGDIYSNNQYKFIFSGLERLEPGDLIYVNYDSVRYTYQMTGSKVVEPTDVSSLIYPTDKPIITLITCTPLGTSRYRLLITAEQISPDYNTTIAEEAPEPAEEPITETTLPANEPSFFERVWQGLFGN